MTDDERMTTYKRADGDTIGGGFSWVTELDFFENFEEEPTELIAEVWQRVSVEAFIYPPPRCLECSAQDKPLSETDDGLLCEECAAEYAAEAPKEKATDT